MSAVRAAAQTLYSQYHKEIQGQHNRAWARCEAHVLSLIPKRAKVFEAHHAVEHARNLYQAEFVKGLLADLCERAVMRAYHVDRDPTPAQAMRDKLKDQISNGQDL